MSSDLARTQLVTQVKDIQGRYYEMATRDFGTFYRGAWNVLEPQTPLVRNWHQSYIGEHLMACELGQIKRLLITMPPRQSKSNLVTVSFPDWVWTKSPHKRFICTSYGDDLSTKHSVDRRTLIESPWYQYGWGDVFKMASDQNVKTEFKNNKMGVMYATSMHGAVTGFGGDYVIADDPHDALKAYSSKRVRDSDVAAYTLKFRNRLNDADKGVLIVVMQRIHKNDLAGELLREQGWTHVKIQGEAEKTTHYSFPISKREKVVEKGETFHPTRVTEAVIVEAKKGVGGSMGFRAQWQQEPTDEEGAIVKRVMFKKRWSSTKADGCIERPTRFDEVIQSWDMAFKETKTSDFVVGGILGRVKADVYLLALVRARMDIIKTISEFKKLTLAWPQARLKIIEDKANGPAVITLLKSEISGIVAYNPKDSKLGRLNAVIPMIESGNYIIPADHEFEWVEAYVDEMIAFTGDEDDHDDQVDMTTQALIRLGRSAKSHLRNLVKM